MAMRGCVMTSSLLLRLVRMACLVYSRDAAFAALREELGRFAHIIFSGNERDRAYWGGNHPDFARNEQRPRNKCSCVVMPTRFHTFYDQIKIAGAGFAPAYF